MVRMNSEITITNAEGRKLILKNQVNSVEIEQTWKNLTQRATIKVPRYKQLVTADKDGYKIKVGDTIQIKLGYDNKLNIEFAGYVSLVKPTSPIEIECEDEMWRLKQTVTSFSWEKTTLIEVLTFLVPGAILNHLPDITFTDGFRIDGISKAEALNKLKEQYGLVVYYRTNAEGFPDLYVGLAYNQPGFKNVKYHFQKNAIPEGLEYRAADAVKYKIKAISILRDNSRVEVTVGDDKGNKGEVYGNDGSKYCEVTKHYYGVTDANVLKKLAEEDRKRMVYDGYSGSFKAFGLPLIQHGDTAELDDDRYPERKMGKEKLKVFVDGVAVSYDSNGFKRTITIGRSAA